MGLRWTEAWRGANKDDVFYNPFEHFHPIFRLTLSQSPVSAAVSSFIGGPHHGGAEDCFCNFNDGCRWRCFLRRPGTCCGNFP
jgi:hypothetical protein